MLRNGKKTDDQRATRHMDGARTNKSCKNDGLGEEVRER